MLRIIRLKSVLAVLFAGDLESVERVVLLHIALEYFLVFCLLAMLPGDFLVRLPVVFSFLELVEYLLE